jgi:16S rRNA (uracil1498-N3)-methyltransferase
MPRRFYLPQPLDAQTLRISGREAHHLLHVLRMEVGQQLWLFDGQGEEALAAIAAIAEGGAELRILERRTAQAETSRPIILGAAVPKGDRFRWLVEKATEIGMQRLVPLQTQRSIVDPREGKLDRMRQTIVEASKQCGRGSLMQLDPIADWKSFVVREFAGGAAFIAHPSGEPLDLSQSPAERPVVLAIGPEGGFTDAEIELGLAAGAKLVSLGPRILRIETAAVALGALVAIGAESER